MTAFKHDGRRGKREKEGRREGRQTRNGNNSFFLKKKEGQHAIPKSSRKRGGNIDDTRNKLRAGKVDPEKMTREGPLQLLTNRLVWIGNWGNHRAKGEKGCRQMERNAIEEMEGMPIFFARMHTKREQYANKNSPNFLVFRPGLSRRPGED